MNKRAILKFGALALVASVLHGCGGNESGEPIATTAKPVQAQSMVLHPELVDVHYISSGTVSADHQVSISSRISGYIRTLTVREGDHVKQGQLLVRVDPVNASQRLVQAEADLADARADLKRYEALYKAHAASKQQLDRVRLRYKVVKSKVAQARNQLGYAEVRSPVNGVVVAKQRSVGDLAAPGAPILTVEDPSSLLVNTYVSERAIGKIHVGDPVDLYITSQDRHVTGRVRQLVDAADAGSHQFLVKVAVKDGTLHSGMFAQVGFTIGQRKVLLIPAAAVVTRADLHGTYIVDSNGVVHYRQVRLGERKGDGRGERFEVLAGLHDGVRIAWQGKPELRSGMKLQDQ